MEILLEETKFSTIAALSASISCKNSNDHLLENKHVQTDRDYTKLLTTKSSFKTAFENLPICEPVDIQFKDISYYVQRLFSKKRKEILHKVNGKFASGQLIAIMGPSGAGKSTLLNALSGYKQQNVSGAIYINGRIRDLNEFRKHTCYITQDDRLQLLLTVYENMKISADLKLGNRFTEQEKNSRIENILSALGLYDHQFTVTKRLSGGQKKRLSVALELISNPTVMFLDEPTTGLDSFISMQMIQLLKEIALQGRTIICTIHQPSAKLFELFDHVYVLAHGQCVYQGHSSKLVPFLQSINLPCPIYHNPADYVIELASAEYGMDKVKLMSEFVSNGESVHWFENPTRVLKLESLRQKHPISIDKEKDVMDVGLLYQTEILLRRGWIKLKRDMTLTHLRITVNIIIALMLGGLFVNSGNEGSRVLDNYNLLFGILMHHMMTTMMLTILTFPTEMNSLTKEYFNRWYSIISYYISITIIDFPITLISSFLFSIIIYTLSAQPPEYDRFTMFFVISLLVVLVAQSIGLVIGACFNIVNGTFVGPTMSVPCMMFAGFGVTIRDLPSYLKWGSYVSYLRYGLEGYVSAIYGDREVLACERALYCHYRYPEKFLSEIAMRGDQFWFCFYALLFTYLFLRVLCYYVLRWKVVSKTS